MPNVYTLYQGSDEKKSKQGSGKNNVLLALPVPSSGYREFREGFIKHLEERYEGYKKERDLLNRIEAAQDLRWLQRTVREHEINEISVDVMYQALSWSMKKLYDQYLRLAAPSSTIGDKKKKSKSKAQSVCPEPGRQFPYIKLKSCDGQCCCVCERQQPIVRVCTKCSRECFYQCSVNLIYQQLGRCWNKAVVEQVKGQPWHCHYCNQLEKGAIKDTETDENLGEFYGKKPRKNYERCAMDEKCKSGGQHVTDKWKLVCNTCEKLRPLTRVCFGCQDWFTTPPPLNYRRGKPPTVFSIFFCVKCKQNVGDNVAEFDNFITKMKKDD